MLKAESKKYNETKLFRTQEEAIAWDSEANIFDPLFLPPLNGQNTPKIAMMQINSAKAEDAFFGEGSSAVYEQKALAFFYRSLGYDVDVITINGKNNTKRFAESSANDYDLVIVLSGGPLISNGKPLPENVVQYGFLASMNQKNFAVIAPDVAIPFLQMVDITNIDPEFRDEKYRIRSKPVFLLHNNKRSDFVKNLVPGSFPKLSVAFLPVFAYAKDWFSNVDPDRQFAPEYDIVYLGTPRWFGDRREFFKEMLVESANKGASVLWLGAKDKKLEFELSSNITLEPPTKNIRGEVLTKGYDRGMINIVPFEDRYEQVVTIRILEALLAKSIVLLDDRFPASSAISRIFDQLAVNRRVKCSEDIQEWLCTLKTSPEKDKIISCLLEDQRKVAESLLDEAVGLHLKLIDDIIVDNIVS